MAAPLLVIEGLVCGSMRGLALKDRTWISGLEGIRGELWPRMTFLTTMTHQYRSELPITRYTQVASDGPLARRIEEYSWNHRACILGCTLALVKLNFHS
jgi:hypothetical protein